MGPLIYFQKLHKRKDFHISLKVFLNFFKVLKGIELILCLLRLILGFEVYKFLFF